MRAIGAISLADKPANRIPPKPPPLDAPGGFSLLGPGWWGLVRVVVGNAQISTFGGIVISLIKWYTLIIELIN